jgi:hypothetical protein
MPQKPREPVLEGSYCSPVYVDDLAEIHKIGPMTHLIFATRQREVGEGRVTRMVQLRLVIPTLEIQAMAHAMLRGETAAPVDCMGNERPLH